MTWSQQLLVTGAAIFLLGRLAADTCAYLIGRADLDDWPGDAEWLTAWPVACDLVAMVLVLAGALAW